jgi:Bacterial PH domain
MPQFPAAAWTVSLKIMSAVGVVLLIVVDYAAAQSVPARGFAHVLGTAVVCIPPLILLFGALFVVRGYEIDRTHLRVRRLLWSTELRIAGVKNVWHDPGAMKGSSKTFGNGGLFAVTGFFRNRALGRYRAFVTDPWRAVVLVLTDKTVVISPAQPQKFVERVSGLYPGARGVENPPPA